MMEYDFAYYLSKFLGKYLPGVVGASTNTISSYRDTFVLFLHFMKEDKSISAERIKLTAIEPQCFCEFLDWLETYRQCTAATRNVRLAAIHAFYRTCNTKPRNVWIYVKKYWQFLLRKRNSVF